MASLVVYMGLIGAGKTAAARRLARVDWELISFDDHWHRGSQAASSPEAFVGRIAQRITRSRFPVVIDGWWTWELRWWDRTVDETLQVLATLLPSREVELRYLRMERGEAWCAYQHKWRRGQYRGTELDDEEAYWLSIPSRIDYMDRRYQEWIEWAR